MIESDVDHLRDTLVLKANVANRLRNFDELDAMARDRVDAGSDPVAVVRIQGIHALSLFSRGETSRAIEIFSECVEAAERLGDTITHGKALGNLGFLLCQGHRIQDGIDALESSITSLRIANQPVLAANFLNLLGRRLHEMGKMIEATSFAGSAGFAPWVRTVAGFGKLEQSRACLVDRWAPCRCQRLLCRGFDHLSRSGKRGGEALLHQSGSCGERGR